METELYTECITCGHSIPLGDTYCGDDECLNRYTEDNELEGHPYADYSAWLAVAPDAHAEVDYHEWAVGHRDLERLESEPAPLPDDAEQIAMLRAALSLTPPRHAAADASPEPTHYTEANEHPTYSHFDWRQAVAERSTELGYHDWAVGQAEAEGPEEQAKGDEKLASNPGRAKDAEIGIIGALLYAILRAGYSITVPTAVPEHEIAQSRDWHAVFLALGTTDKDELVLHRAGQAFTAGWIHLEYGQQGYTVIADYFKNPTLAAIIQDVQPVLDYYQRLCTTEPDAPAPKHWFFIPAFRAQVDALPVGSN